MLGLVRKRVIDAFEHIIGLRKQRFRGAKRGDLAKMKIASESLITAFVVLNKAVSRYEISLDALRSRTIHIVAKIDDMEIDRGGF